MKVILTAMLATSLSSGLALAQYSTTPHIDGGPQYGTSSPDGASATVPDTYGTPEYGKATREPGDRICVTTPNLISKPQYGTMTTCYWIG